MPFALRLHMRVRLTRKLAERIDGIDLSGRSVGDVLDLPDREALCLIAEGWALPLDAAGDGGFHRSPDAEPAELAPLGPLDLAAATTDDQVSRRRTRKRL